MLSLRVAQGSPTAPDPCASPPESHLNRTIVLEDMDSRNKPLKPATCGRCRNKKIRCNGQRPCDKCLRARVGIECRAAPAVSHTPELRKGYACSACRRKKKKCSGEWPCRTCIISKKEDDCKFDDGSELSFTRALIERTLELEQLLSAAKSPPPNFSVGADLSAELDELLASNPAVVAEPLDKQPLLDNLTAMATLLREDETLNYLETAAALPPLPTPPVVESPEEKMLRLRKLFLVKEFQLGFTLPPHKVAALIAGDLSGTVVHPVLIHVSHLWGYMLDYFDQKRSWAYAPNEDGDEVEQMRLILGSLAGEFGPPPDPFTRFLAYQGVCFYFYHKNEFQRGQEFWTLASDTVLKHDLDLALTVPPVEDETTTYSLRPLTDANELRAAFSTLIYVALDTELVLSAPPIIQPRLLAKFDQLMDTHVVNNADLSFVRTKSIRLLAQTRRLTTAWDAGKAQGQSPAAPWFENYWKLIEQLNTHIGRLNHIHLRVSFIPDAHTAELQMKLCLIVAIAALADLHGIFAPSHVESSRRYRDTVVEIVSISSTFTIDDCRYLDAILSFCWSVATKRILSNEVVYENQQPIIAAIRACNSNLQQMLPYVPDFENINRVSWDGDTVPRV
ncbi:hypothetical protein B0H16DRAFT_1513611 [Mycena metata]|uniref:Zn(2)-C6 fungal-type domain-containing protein n=1 Tax=Mycena metata TaxID=1033252 RepID=A0AAD7NQQ1_9AGAR|nr:hypothetical protein B0H16DRAFT_1513611 [Mycena metata]